MRTGMKNESDGIDAVRVWGAVPVGQARSVGALAAASREWSFERAAEELPEPRQSSWPMLIV